jgi:hypothetical protein
MTMTDPWRSAVIDRAKPCLVGAVLCWVAAVSPAGCARYTPEEQARFKDIRCQWIIWSADMPGQEECAYLLKQP